MAIAVASGSSEEPSLFLRENFVLPRSSSNEKVSRERRNDEDDETN